LQSLYILMMCPSVSCCSHTFHLCFRYSCCMSCFNGPCSLPFNEAARASVLCNFILEMLPVGRIRVLTILNAVQNFSCSFQTNRSISGSYPWGGGGRDKIGVLGKCRTIVNWI
jgi:hypothetical protein